MKESYKKLFEEEKLKAQVFKEKAEFADKEIRKLQVQVMILERDRNIAKSLHEALQGELKSKTKEYDDLKQKTPTGETRVFISNLIRVNEAYRLQLYGDLRPNFFSRIKLLFKS